MTGLFYSRYWPLATRLLPVLSLSVYLAAVLFAARRFSSIENQFIRYAVAFVVVQIITLMILTIGLISGKAVAAHEGNRRKTRTDRLADLMTRYVVNGETEAALLAEAVRYPREFLAVLETALKNLREPSRRRVEQLLEQSGLQRRLFRQIQDRNPNRALAAIALLRHIDSEECRQAIEQALNHPAEVVRMAARIALLGYGSQAAQERMLEELPQLPFWQRVVLFQQLPRDSPVLQHYLERAFQSEKHDVVLAALEFTLSRQRLQPVVASGRLASSPNPEVRIKFFKALPFLLTDVEHETLLRVGLADPDWRVRAMAGRACGSLRATSLVPDLVERLHATSHAAEAGHLARALAAIGGDAWRPLHELTVSENRLTRAIAVEVIERTLTGPLQTAL